MLYYYFQVSIKYPVGTGLLLYYKWGGNVVMPQQIGAFSK
jgi:hypothetical protein